MVTAFRDTDDEPERDPEFARDVERLKALILARLKSTGYDISRFGVSAGGDEARGSRP